MVNNKITNKKSAAKKALGISKTILAIIYEMGSGTIKAFFPHPYYHTFCNHNTKQHCYQTMNRLTKNGFVVKKSNTFRLTKRGEKEAFFAHLDACAILHQPKKRKWDGRWRMIIFDVPEKKRKYRDYLRQMLKTLGFKELQKSTWVTPYPIPDFLKELLWEERMNPERDREGTQRASVSYGIKHFTRFITIKEIDYDKDLREVFNLSQ